jgi:hypothetical protein
MATKQRRRWSAGRVQQIQGGWKGNRKANERYPKILRQADNKEGDLTRESVLGKSILYCEWKNNDFWLDQTLMQGLEMWKALHKTPRLLGK